MNLNELKEALRERFNFMDVVIEACKSTGIFLNANSARNDKEHKLEKALIPEVCTYLSKYADLGRRLRENLHAHVKNSKEDMDNAGFIWTSFCKFVARFGPDDSIAVGKFAYYYPRAILIPRKEREYAKKGQSIYFDNRVKEDIDDTFVSIKQRYIYVFFVSSITGESREEILFFNNNEETIEEVKVRFFTDFKGYYSENDVIDFSDVYERTIRTKKEFLI